MTEQGAAGAATRSKFQRWSIRIGIGVAAVLVLGLGFIGFAEHHTAQPDFCGSCHIMEAYHETWKADLHGTKLGVACVECHYAPGERTTVKAKLRGLSQVASYVSGRYGSTRPRAHVSNESCMTSKCHGDGRFMDKNIEVGSVRFNHASHFRLHENTSAPVQKELAELAQSLRAVVGDAQFEKLEAKAREAGPHKPRIDSLVKLASLSGAEVKRDDLERFSQLHHRDVRLAQLADIQCTNCHTYGGKTDEHGKNLREGHHFSVNLTSCYTCHFNNEGFNTGTNNCLMCHKQLPAGDILVHKELTGSAKERLATPELTKVVKMNHQAILDRKVDCASCHADVAIEPAHVARRDCDRCHDSPRYFEKWREPLTVDVVAEYHKQHVAGQRAKCLDCHTEIHHQLIREPKQGEPSEPAFLTSIMSNCSHCHPNHHREQLNLLSGVGALAVPKSDPNLMFGSRTNCLGCHTEMASDKHGGEVYKATLTGCLACHGDRHANTFEKWKQGLELVSMEAEETYTNARKLLEETPEIPEEARRKATELLAGARADLQLIKRGNGLHNVTYAIEVLDTVTQRAQQAITVLTEAQPKPPENEEK